MSNLKRQSDGSYHGTYKGQTFRVWKEGTEELTRSGWRWAARSGRAEYQTLLGGTRADAIKGICLQLDMAAIDVPEIDALLKRWAEEIQAIVPLLEERDGVARVQLESLSSQLTLFDQQMRGQAVRFEQKLAKLRARMQQAPATLVLESRI
jgi:hypothetical protein